MTDFLWALPIIYMFAESHGDRVFIYLFLPMSASKLVMNSSKAREITHLGFTDVVWSLDRKLQIRFLDSFRGTFL